MPYTNNNGQTRVGIRSGVLVAQTPSASTLWNSIYAVYNGDSVGSQSLKTSLYAAYNGESNANDSFGSNNGTAQGGLTYTTGKIGNAFNFNGTNAYVGIPNTSGQLDFTGDFSISTWVMPYVTSASYNVYFSNYKAGGTYGSGFVFFLDRTVNKLSFSLRNQTNMSIYGYSWIPLVNTWYHLTVTRKASTGTKLYINGVEVVGSFNPSYSGVTLNPTYQTGQIYNIGSTLNGDNLGNYRQDAVNIWQKELSQSEITELYNSGNGAQYIGDSFYRPTTGDGLYNNNGTAQGGLTYVPGKVGTAFQFNGTNAYVDLPNNSFNFTGDFSVSGWINQSSIKPYHMIIGNQGTSTGNWHGWLVWVFNNKLTFDLYNGNSAIASGRWQTTTTLSTNTWIHFTITKKPGQAVKIYLDGVIDGGLLSGSNSANVTYTTTNYSSIGVNKYSSPIVVADAGYWNGSMDALNVWNKELTQSEITELYNSGNGKQYVNTNIITNGLILNLDASNTSSYSGTGTTWANLVGGSYNATLYNGVSYTSTNSGGLTFDGVNDYVLLNSANKPSTTLTNSGFSFGFWFSLNGWSSGKGILQIAYPNSLTSTTPTFLINTVNTDQIQYYIGGAGWAGSTTLTNKNAPQYFAFTVSSDSSNVTILKVYINGVYQFTVNNPFDLGTFNNKDIYIGNGYNGFMSMNCYSVHMYNNKTLTDAEVLQNYINTKSRFGL